MEIKINIDGKELEEMIVAFIAREVINKRGGWSE